MALKEDNELQILRQLFNNLNPEKKKAFLNSIKTKDKNVEVPLSLQPIKTKCPFCGSEHIVKNGTAKGTQRLLCRDCHKTFSHVKNTVFARSKYSLSTWKLYVECMLNKFSIRKCAKECNISVPTAFYWRHKILDALREDMGATSLNGVVEADETFTLLSFKGSRHLPRKAHHRGTPATKRGLSKEQVCIPCGVNLEGQSVGKISNLGKPSLKDLQKVLTNRVTKGSVFVTDSLRPYQKISLDMDLTHIRIPRKHHSVGNFNINTVNNYHKQFKELIIGRFHGVSTKYLNNYLAYNQYVNFAKGSEEEKQNRIEALLIATSFSKNIKQLTNRPAVPV